MFTFTDIVLKIKKTELRKNPLFLPGKVKNNRTCKQISSVLKAAAVLMPRETGRKALFNFSWKCDSIWTAVHKYIPLYNTNVINNYVQFQADLEFSREYSMLWNSLLFRKTNEVFWGGLQWKSMTPGACGSYCWWNIKGRDCLGIELFCKQRNRDSICSRLLSRSPEAPVWNFRP